MYPTFHAVSNTNFYLSSAVVVEIIGIRLGP